MLCRGLLQSLSQGWVVVAAVVTEAVDEEGRRTAHPAVDSALDVLLYPSDTDFSLEVLLEPGQVHSQPSGVAAQIVIGQRVLVGEQQGVHVPELPLECSS